MKICPKCGAENRDAAKYCNSCGAVFKSLEEEFPYNEIGNKEEMSENNKPIDNTSLANPEVIPKNEAYTDRGFINIESDTNQVTKQNKTAISTKTKRILIGAILILLFCSLLFLIVSNKKQHSQKETNYPDKSHIESSDTTQYANDVKYTLEEFGNINYCIPEGWHKESVNVESSSKEIKYYNSLNPDDFCMFFDLSTTDIDYSFGVSRIIDTALNNFDNDSIKETVIDGVKFKYADYTVEDGDVRYQRFYTFPCSENEIGMLLIAWKHDGSEELQFLERIVESFTFSQKLPNDIATY